MRKIVNRLVVIGGCAAGMSAAASAKRQDPELNITVYESSGFVSYGSCGLPYYVSGVVEDHNDLIVYTPEFFREKRGIEVFTHHAVESVDSNAKKLTVRNLNTNETFEDRFDRLVIATGGSAVVPRFPGADLPNVFTMRRVEDGIAIRSFIESRSPRSAVIVGGGYIGGEMAESLVQIGMKVSLVEKLLYLLGMDQDISDLIADHIRSKGVDVYLSTEVREIQPDRVVTDKGEIGSELVILGVGVKPNTELARIARLSIGTTGAIEVDRRMTTSHPSIFAAGDCVQVRNLVTNKPDYVPLGTHANKQGKVAGINAAGGDAEFTGVIGSMVTKVFEAAIGRTGLTERKAAENGFLPQSATIEAHTRAHYYPGSSDIIVKLTADRRTRKVIGAQVIGREEVARRVDVIATAIHAGMTVDQVYELDLCYAPPFAPVWDPTLIAARALIKTLD